MLAVCGFLAMFLMIGLRAPIGLAMLLVGSCGYMILSSPVALFSYMKTNAYHQFANYTLSVIPLFILMGAIAERAGIASQLFKVAERSFRKRRGGLAMAVIGSCTAFGAICGSSVATTATFGRAALPELLKARYDGGLATATIAVGGTLGILIPPSVILVVYAITTEQNIAKLFQAALVPGLLAALLYILTIAIVVRRNPDLAPVAEEDANIRPSAKPLWPKLAAACSLVLVATQVWRGALDWEQAVLFGVVAAMIAMADVAIMPVIAIAVIVVGGIYGGVFTPTEGAAVGVIAMLAVGLLGGKLTFREILVTLRQTAETSGMIFLILLGAEVFGAFLALSQLPSQAAQMISGTGLPPLAVLSMMLVFYILLGAIMDELAMILLTLPLFFPVIQALDFGMPPDEAAIWFGVLVLMVVGIGLTAPPVGLNVFVISSLARQIPILSIYKGVLPFLLSDILRVLLVLIFPGTALWLVRFFN
ncbi:DctQ TRAP-type C4-dicarboxylate transport system, large permease component [Rhabdaerophilaceae bacterium]